MSIKIRKFKKPMGSENKENTNNYEVGYGKPPRHTQFRKGQSGNKKGHPKGVKNKSSDLSSSRLSDLILKEGSKLITVKEGGEVLEIPKIEAALKSLSTKAIKGNHQSQKLFISLYSETEAAKKELEDKKCEELVYYKRDLEEAIEHAEREGLPIPDPIPHPKHIIIDLRHNEIHLIGPMSEIEKKIWDLEIMRKLIWQQDLKKMEWELAITEDPEQVESKQHKIDRLRHYIKLIQMRIPDDIYIPHSTKEYIKSNSDIQID